MYWNVECSNRVVRYGPPGLHRASIPALRTCRYRKTATRGGIDRELVEWKYGDYEGLRSDQILNKRPDWDLFRDGAPGGESPAQIGQRVDGVVERIRTIEGDVFVFSSGHFIRVLAARWLALESCAARYLFLNPTILSALGYEHEPTHPAIRLWNDDHHVLE